MLPQYVHGHGEGQKSNRNRQGEPRAVTGPVSGPGAGLGPGLAGGFGPRSGVQATLELLHGSASAGTRDGASGVVLLSPVIAVHQSHRSPLPAVSRSVTQVRPLGLFRWEPCGMWASPCLACSARLAPSLILWI